MAIDPRTDPHAHLVTTPLPSKMAKAAHPASGAHLPKDGEGDARASAPAAPDPFLRAPNEDDDGYDPYSDRPADNPFFEPNPWD